MQNVTHTRNYDNTMMVCPEFDNTLCGKCGHRRPIKGRRRVKMCGNCRTSFQNFVLVPNTHGYKTTEEAWESLENAKSLVGLDTSLGFLEKGLAPFIRTSDASQLIVSKSPSTFCVRTRVRRPGRRTVLDRKIDDSASNTIAEHSQREPSPNSIAAQASEAYERDLDYQAQIGEASGFYYTDPNTGEIVD